MKRPTCDLACSADWAHRAQDVEEGAWSPACSSPRAQEGNGEALWDRSRGRPHDWSWLEKRRDCWKAREDGKTSLSQHYLREAEMLMPAISMGVQMEESRVQSDNDTAGRETVTTEIARMKAAMQALGRDEGEEIRLLRAKQVRRDLVKGMLAEL